MLLSEQPMHAYQIEKIVEQRAMREWTEISMSSIYKLLRKLEARRLISSRQQQSERGMNRNLFRLTAAGRKALEAQLCRLLTEPEHMIWRIDLATSHLSVLPREKARVCLTAYRGQLQESIACYRQLDAYLEEAECPQHGRALARRPQYLLQAEIDWVDDYLRDLESAGHTETIPSAVEEQSHV